jgi:glycine oxidase
MVDVTVMGAGAFGLSVAYACATRGARVRVIDPGGVGAGSSGGIVGALAPHTPERWEPKKQFQFEALIAARSFWPEVERLGGVSSGYGNTGRLQPIADQHGLDLARERVEASAELWQGKALWQVVEAAPFGDWAPFSATGLLVQDSLSARLHPKRACDALAAALIALGGEIVTSGAPEGMVVWATGYQGLLELSAARGQEVGNGVKGQALLLEFDAGARVGPAAPQLFSGGVHVVPHADGTVAIGSTSERYFDLPDQCDDQVEAVWQRALAAFPVLEGAPVIRRWAGVRPRAKTRAPMLGQYPGRDGQFIANGGFKIGFGMAPGIGAVMADLVLDGVDNIPVDFRVEASL